jgi:hypothetical protein
MTKLLKFAVLWTIFTRDLLSNTKNSKSSPVTINDTEILKFAEKKKSEVKSLLLLYERQDLTD